MVWCNVGSGLLGDAGWQMSACALTRIRNVQLMGMCESMWKPGLEPEELFETVSQCLLAGADRDCLSGWGATVYIICPDKVITRTLRGRMD
jgi:20S proteasome alpha/beta subunit